jgi:ribose/xylose/arabinose/galactoside ABC-type transport system permease subunit
MSVPTTKTRPAAKSGNGRSGISAVIDPQILGLVIALVALIALFGSQIPGAFFTPVNVMSIAEGVTLVGLTALGEMTVMIMGGLDIAIGSLVGICSAAAGMAMLGKANNAVDIALIGIGVAVVAGVLGGWLNGIIVIKGKIDPIIVTLGTYSAYRGIALLVTGNGYAVNVRNEAFNSIGTGTLFGIPISIVVLIVAVIIFHYFLEHTVAGRDIFAIGGNPVAARLAGINVSRYKLAMYVLAGFMAAVAAVVYTARTQSGQPVSGSEELAIQAITAAILGGVALKGGKGKVVGVVLGMLIIGTLNNGMILMSIPTFYQRIARGLLLIVAVLIQNWRVTRK